jgi:N-acetylneuraminate synthase
VNEELNLDVIPALQERYGIPIGYSGHEVGVASSVVAAALGACAVERHITTSRALWGSDQAASLESDGIGHQDRQSF